VISIPKVGKKVVQPPSSAARTSSGRAGPTRVLQFAVSFWSTALPSHWFATGSVARLRPGVSSRRSNVASLGLSGSDEEESFYRRAPY
jgi:hypothetical protein